MDVSEALLKAILATVARTTFPPDVLFKIVAPNSNSEKQLLAYNLCDGQTPQVEIGKKSKMLKGNLSGAISRWVEAGVMIRIGPERLPLHLYPIIRPAGKATNTNR